MDTSQWSQEIVVNKPMEEIAPKQSSIERRLVRPHKEQALSCPRCSSSNTKFCYYNNYSLSQPRYFCKTCRRYWTEGGSLRNIPVGGGSRKNKRSSATATTSSLSSSSSSALSSKKLTDLVPTNLQLPPSQNPKINNGGQDLNLGFPASHHDFKTITDLIQVPSSFDNNNSSSKGQMPSSSSSTTSHHHPLSALELLTGITSRGLNSFMPMAPMTDLNVDYSSGFTLPEFRSSLNFSPDGMGSSTGCVQEANGRVLFPFEDLKHVSSTSDSDQQNRDNNLQGDSTGYWNGMLGGGSW